MLTGANDRCDERAEFFPGLHVASRRHVGHRHPLRRRRRRPAGAAAARISADARDVASRRAGARAPVHGRVRRSARLRRFRQARVRRDARRVFEARDGAGHGRADARPGPSRGSPRRSRSRRRASRIGCASTTRMPCRSSPCSTSRRRARCTRSTDQAFATAYYHWFFLIQPFDLPERLIGADPVYYLHRKLGGWGTGARASSIRARSPSTSAASAIRRRSTRRCEDYRAAASIDLEHDAAERSAEGRMSAARAVGRARRRASAVQAARRLARGGDRRARAVARLRSLPRGRSARRDAARA